VWHGKLFHRIEGDPNRIGMLTNDVFGLQIATADIRYIGASANADEANTFYLDYSQSNLFLVRTIQDYIRKVGPDYLAYALLDSIIDHYYPVLESIGTEIDTIEDELVDNPLVRPVGSLHEHKRTLTQIRRMVWPLRDVTNLLLHEDPGLIRPETKVYLRDCYDHSVQLMDVVESYRDVLSGLTEIHISSIGMRTNEIMRVLTVISSVFIPLTFIAGVYGMNFAHMPELSEPWGYGACLVLMLIVGLGQLLYFKKRHWL